MNTDPFLPLAKNQLTVDHYASDKDGHIYQIREVNTNGQTIVCKAVSFHSDNLITFETGQLYPVLLTPQLIERIGFGPSSMRRAYVHEIRALNGILVSQIEPHTFVLSYRSNHVIEVFHLMHLHQLIFYITGTWLILPDYENRKETQTA